MKKPLTAVSSTDHRCVMTRRGKVYPRRSSVFATFITAPSWMVVRVSEKGYEFSTLRSTNRKYTWFYCEKHLSQLYKCFNILT